VALAFGDDTAKRRGRLTLNPLAHIDPIGTIVVPALLAFSGYGLFGWAKRSQSTSGACVIQGTRPCSSPSLGRQ